MPELPEVETVRRGLEAAMLGARFTRVEQRRRDLRFPFPKNFAGRLEGRTVTSLKRRAKYILAELDDGHVLVLHLGMSGSFRVEDEKVTKTPGSFHHLRPKDVAHDHVAFHLSNGARVIYNDPRRFGFMNIIEANKLNDHALFRNVGIEPLGNELNGANLARLFAGKSAPLKSALSDQRLIAGLGNIYVNEALHRAGLSPRRAAGSIARKNGAPTERAERLAHAIREVLEEAVAAGGSSLRDHRQTNGELGYFQHKFRVYHREGQACPRCGGTVKRIVQAGRATFFCGKCQK
ncbi:MAG: bifunctional DNA-formamidopyrimidine glycosylase/DNA-(apurinic or apyrimidinic site) lyase [Methylovirgula sp.]